MDKREFCKRFVDHMTKSAGTDKFLGGESIRKYAKDAAPTYYDNQYKDDQLSPSDCAEADMDCWEYSI